jgi:3-dehydroquinate synthase
MVSSATHLPPIRIRSSLADYGVEVHTATALADWQPGGDFLLIDAFLEGRLRVPPHMPVLAVEAHEGSKSFDALLPVFLALKEAGLGRSHHLMAVGGGVIQDIATFVSSLYMRGISWSYAPTTFLGMADSCLGGKSSINAGPYKNLIGNFHPPETIEILPAFARSLPLADLRGGAAEAAKIAWCRGQQAFARHVELAAPLLAGSWSDAELAELVHATLTIKRWFIERDEFDRAERRLLNFGHTWGHALESATGFAIPHGLAVAIGMLAAVEFVGRDAASAPLYAHALGLLEGVVPAAALAAYDPEAFLRAFRADKKHGPEHLHLIVPGKGADGLGVEEVRLPAEEATLTAVRQAMERALAEVGALGEEPA